MQKRKITIEVDIDDEKVNCIEDLEQEILAQNIHKQVASKYLESLQYDLSQQEVKKCISKHLILNLISWQNEHLMKREKNIHSALST